MLLTGGDIIAAICWRLAWFRVDDVSKRVYLSPLITIPTRRAMRRSEEARRWFSEAEWDLESARILHDSRRYNSCAFLCQQSAEKSGKALLYSVGESPFGHSVLQLLQRYAEASGKDLSELKSSAGELDRHYIPARYPNAMPSGSPHENYDQEVSERALQCAMRILDYVRRQLR